MAEEILNSEQKQIINSVKIDSGGNFLNGGATSAFASTVGVARSGVSVIGETINAAGVVADITASFVQNLQTKLMDCVSKATVDLMKIPTETISYWTSETVKAKTISVSELMQELTEGAEDHFEKVAEKLENEQKEEMIKNASEKVKEVSEKVSYVMSTVSSKVDSITAYITKGPEWIEKQLNKCSYTILTQTQKNIESTTKSFDEAKKTWAESFGKSMGEKIVAPINEKTKKAQKKILEKADETKAKLKSKASAAVAQALMKIKGLFGR